MNIIDKMSKMTSDMFCATCQALNHWRFKNRFEAITLSEMNAIRGSGAILPLFKVVKSES